MSSSDVIAICASIIALSASAGVFWQVFLIRNHNMLSVKPHLSFTVEKHPSYPIKYVLRNTGLGPAVIKKFVLIVNDTEYSVISTKDVVSVLNLIGINVLGRWAFAFPDIDSAIPSNDALVLIEFQGSTDNPSFYRTLEENLTRLSFKIEYECMYENKFLSTFAG